jgi:hypothetical protein
VSQTSGEPIPERPRPRLLAGEAPAGLWEGLAAQVREHGFTLTDALDAAYGVSPTEYRRQHSTPPRID